MSFQTTALIQITANPRRDPCGCREWDDCVDGAWVHRRSLCLRHQPKETP